VVLLTTSNFRVYSPENVRQLRTTADKSEIKDFPKLPPATSFIRKTISRHVLPQLVPKVGLRYNVEVDGTMIGIDCRCGIITAAYRKYSGGKNGCHN
jgi:hypothetical protein